MFPGEPSVCLRDGRIDVGVPQRRERPVPWGMRDVGSVQGPDEERRGRPQPCFQPPDGVRERPGVVVVDDLDVVTTDDGFDVSLERREPPGVPGRLDHGRPVIALPGSERLEVDPRQLFRRRRRRRCRDERDRMAATAELVREPRCHPRAAAEARVAQEGDPDAARPALARTDADLLLTPRRGYSRECQCRRLP